MKVLFVKEVLGLTKLHYYLKTENEEKHNEYLKDLLENGYLEDLTEVFTEEADKNFIRTAHGFLELDNKIYCMPNEWSEQGKHLRTDKKGIEIIEKYNQFLKKPMKIDFEEIKEEDFDRMYIMQWEDCSESVMFNE